MKDIVDAYKYRFLGEIIVHKESHQRFIVNNIYYVGMPYPSYSIVFVLENITSGEYKEIINRQELDDNYERANDFIHVVVIAKDLKEFREWKKTKSKDKNIYFPCTTKNPSIGARIDKIIFTPEGRNNKYLKEIFKILQPLIDYYYIPVDEE